MTAPLSGKGPTTSRQSPEPDTGSSPGIRDSQRKAGLPLGPCGWRKEKGPQGTCSIVPGTPVSS